MNEILQNESEVKLSKIIWVEEIQFEANVVFSFSQCLQPYSLSKSHTSEGWWQLSSESLKWRNMLTIDPFFVNTHNMSLSLHLEDGYSIVILFLQHPRALLCCLCDATGFYPMIFKLLSSRAGGMCVKTS